MRGPLSVKEFSAQVGNHPQSTYRLIWTGELRAVKKPGLGWRILEDPAEWLKKDQVNDGSSAQEIKRLQKMILSTPPDGDITPLGGDGEMAQKGKSKSRINLGYGAIYQRTTKQGITRWYLDFRNGEGERVQKVAPEAITARDAIHALKKEVLKTLNDRYELKVKKIGFLAFSKLYLQNYVMVKRRNWGSDKFRLDALGEYFGDNQDLREITPMTIQGMIKARQKAGNAGSTINRYLALLKHMLNKAVEEGYLETNPAKKIKPFRETNRIERVLSHDEEKKLLAHSSGYLRSVLIIGLNTGMRLGEILSLKWGQIDFGAGKIVVEKTKSGKSRTVFINSPLLAELQNMKSLNRKCPHLFLNEQTKRPLGRVSRAFLTACKKAKVENFRIHDCRHTFISRLLEKGADVETVRSLAGHSSLAMVQRYAHSQDGMKRKAVELLNEEPEKSPETGGVVLHPCDMDKPKQGASLPVIPPSRSFSWN